MAKTTKSPDVFECIRQGDFFELLEEQAWRGEAAPLWPWLNLFTTDAIEAWAKVSQSISKVGSRRRHGNEVLRLLLTRHLLNLNSRRNPSPLHEFWRWAVPGESYSFMQQLWERLPSTLDEGAVTLEGIADQEGRFTSLVAASASELEQRGGPAWAITSLRDLVMQRREPIKNPAAQVVFGWTRSAPENCRPGILVEFRLLARCGSTLRLSKPEPFDDRFLAALEQDVHSRVDAVALRNLEHDWGFLPPKTLSDRSGTMAFWVALTLASPGRRFGGHAWAVPPWVVTSAAVERDSVQAFGGTAGNVAFVGKKLKVLAEEGVRVLALCEANLPPPPHHSDIVVLPVSGNACDVANRLLNSRLLLKTDLSTLDSTLVDDRADIEVRNRVRQRREAHRSFFDPLSDYLPPDYAFRELEAGIARLSGRGYVHVKAPSGQGKSVLARALRHDGKQWGKPPGSLSNALVHSILRGEPASLRVFLDAIDNQARRFDTDDLLAHRGIDRLHSVPAARQWVKALLEDVCRLLQRDGNRQTLLLVVDGLDEIDTLGDSDADITTLDLLPRPAELPQGCFVVLTTRPSVPSWLSNRLAKCQSDFGPGLFLTVAMNGETEGYPELLNAFLSNSLGGDASHLASAIIEKAQGSFLYVRLLRDLVGHLLRRGRPASEFLPSDLPSLNDVIPVYLEQLRISVNVHHDDPYRFDQWHRQVLLMLAAAYEPVDVRCLLLWLQSGDDDGPELQHVLECTLDELAPLVRDDTSFPIRRRCYALAHAELAEWFATNEEAAWGTTAHIEISRLIARQGLRLFQADALRNEVEAGCSAAVYYHYWQLPSHLLDIDDIEAAVDFLSADWQNELHEKMTKLIRTTIFSRELLRVASARTSQYRSIFQSLPQDSSDWLDAAMWCMRGLGRSLLDQIESREALGQPMLALKHVGHLSEILDSKETQSVHLTDALPACERREYWRLVVERDLWRARLATCVGNREVAAGAVREADEKLDSLAQLFIGERGERDVIWWVSAISETIERSLDLHLGAAPAAAWLSLNQVALGMI